MCGRFVAAADLEAVAAFFDTPLPGFVAPRSYNVSPTTDIVAVVGDARGSRQLETFRWGLVPSWSTDPKKGPPLFNARSETAATKNSFRAALRRRRCIVPADGFYEWPKGDAGAQADARPLPHYVTRSDGGMLAMAGLWERWTPKGGASGESLHSATVMTTAANAFMSPIHRRMPVLLERSAWDAWLDPDNDDVDVLATLLVPAAPDVLRSHQVGREVGNVRNRDASLIEPAEPDALF